MNRGLINYVLTESPCCLRLYRYLLGISPIGQVLKIEFGKIQKKLGHSRTKAQYQLKRLEEIGTLVRLNKPEAGVPIEIELLSEPHPKIKTPRSSEKDLKAFRQKLKRSGITDKDPVQLSSLKIEESSDGSVLPVGKSQVPL